MRIAIFVVTNVVHLLMHGHCVPVMSSFDSIFCAKIFRYLFGT